MNDQQTRQRRILYLVMGVLAIYGVSNLAAAIKADSSGAIIAWSALLVANVAVAIYLATRKRNPN